MDLRKFTKPEHITKAIKLAKLGKLDYQPFIFSNDLEVGAGFGFCEGEFKGRVAYPDFLNNDKVNSEKLHVPVDEEDKKIFSDANSGLRNLYEYFINEICEVFGTNYNNLSMADVGCNSGYFPISFAKRGFKTSVGFDREDYSDTIQLFNNILNANVKFIHNKYDGNFFWKVSRQFDLVISIAVLCHLSDPLQHLAYLGKMSKEAIFISTPVRPDDFEYSIHFGEPNKYYGSDDFPFSFDNLVRPSRRLLKKSLNLMGFTNIYELPMPEIKTVPFEIYYASCHILAVKSNSSFEKKLNERSKMNPIKGNPYKEMREKYNATIYGNHNIFNYGNEFIAVPDGTRYKFDEKLDSKILKSKTMDSIIEAIDKSNDKT